MSAAQVYQQPGAKAKVKDRHAQQVHGSSARCEKKWKGYYASGSEVAPQMQEVQNCSIPFTTL